MMQKFAILQKVVNMIYGKFVYKYSFSRNLTCIENKTLNFTAFSIYEIFTSYQRRYIEEICWICIHYLDVIYKYIYKYRYCKAPLNKRLLKLTDKFALSWTDSKADKK